MVMVLALGIGGNTAIFTLAKAAFLDPLPFRDSDRLITLVKNDGSSPSVSEFVSIRARSRALEQMAFAEYRDMQIEGTGEPVRVFGASLTASFFPLLGINAALGRTLLEEENRPRMARAAVLTDRFWRSRMGADASVVGRMLRVDGQAARVVGVLPPGFHFDYPTLRIPEPVEIYVSHPLEVSAPLQSNGSWADHVFARLPGGIAQGQARSELETIGQGVGGRLSFGLSRSLGKTWPVRFWSHSAARGHCGKSTLSALAVVGRCGCPVADRLREHGAASVGSVVATIPRGCNSLSLGR
jgi:hypothetical protein